MRVFIPKHTCQVINQSYIYLFFFQKSHWSISFYIYVHIFFKWWFMLFEIPIHLYCIIKRWINSTILCFNKCKKEKTWKFSLILWFLLSHTFFLSQDVCGGCFYAVSQIYITTFRLIRNVRLKSKSINYIVFFLPDS